jgi:hypothetical protein
MDATADYNDKMSFARAVCEAGSKWNVRGSRWERALFDYTSWRFFREDEFEGYLDHSDFFIALILAADIGYQRDIFIFPVRDFVRLVRLAIPSKGQRKVYISRSLHDPTKWYLRRITKITALTPDAVTDVSSYRRNFAVLNPA